jgi:transposase
MKKTKSQEKILKLYLGVDLHNESFNTHVIDENERKVDSRKVPTTEEAIRKYFEPYRPHCGLDVVVAVEAGNPTFWFCDILEEMGIKFEIVNTLDYSRTSNNKQKNDKRDARNLAFDLKRKNLPTIPVNKTSPIQRMMRTLVTHRDQYVKDKVRTVNRTYCFLSGRGIKVKKKNLKGSLKAWEGIFAQLKDKSGIQNVDFVLAELRLYYQDFKRLKTQIKNIEDRIYTLIKKHYLQIYKKLITLPGIGCITAYCLIAQVGDWSRFKSGKNLTSYFGLTPSNRETGNKKLKGDGRITKEGSSLMRNYLLQGAITIVGSTAKRAIPLQQWYENVKIRKGWRKARVALIRKMCEVLFAMIRKGEDYDPSLLIKNSKPAL